MNNIDHQSDDDELLKILRVPKTSDNSNVDYQAGDIVDKTYIGHDFLPAKKSGDHNVLIGYKAKTYG